MKSPVQAGQGALQSETKLAYPSTAERPAPTLAWSSGLLTAATFACCAVAGPAGYFLSGRTGLVAACAAAVFCCLGAFGALLVARWFRGPNGLLPRVLGGMFMRMTIPLAAVLGVQLSRSPLADAGFVYYVLVFYLVTLAVETGLWVRHG
jgi:hypothetical protein